MEDTFMKWNLGRKEVFFIKRYLHLVHLEVQEHFQKQNQNFIFKTTYRVWKLSGVFFAVVYLLDLKIWEK